ncbi:LytR C-terminal domain-containing protein [Anaeromicropila populeti]|uniref:Transcriptional attenuator, LytR family n=1 Tax=Anaeromicropila populeti TaxID=37658 RepID=A0A1I6IE44_9FIRM|nr:LytR C-terminal domain-containing protein [Anaeromicropila populeti]SFR65047.1 transcriptional attenuator, LytR family [Anaeromicropila populeti]
MKKTPLKIFLRGFARTFIYISLFVALFSGSYMATKAYYNRTKDDLKNKSAADKQGILTEAQVDIVAHNLIFGVNNTTGAIKYMLLEIFHSDTYTLSYITIPVNSEITLSQDFYQKLYTVNPEIPQIIRLNEVHEYLDEDIRYDSVIQFLESALELDISYYTVMNTTDFKTLFKMKKGESYLIFKDSFKEQIREWSSEQDIIQYIKEQYSNSFTNISLKNKLLYTPALYKTKMENVSFYQMPGNESGDSFSLDVEKCNTLLADIKNGTEEEKIREDIGDYDVTSEGLAIKILNGSNIAGLAAAYQEKLVADGYNVIGLGNYNSGILTNTIIYVRDSQYGKDLLAYFKDASIEVSGGLPENVEIEIVLGTMDQLSGGN